MALFDDRRFLLSHINHSFITGDDTGICEVVMLDEDVFENQHQRCLKLEGQNDEKPEDRLEPEAYDLDYESELFESEQGQSYDIASDLDYICHRRRSNTAQRLDRLKKEKINQSRTKTIVWRCDSPTSSQNDDKSSQDLTTPLDDLSEKSENDAQNRKAKSPPMKSGLTRLLEKFPSLPKNPFDEFAQFDGGMSETVPVKKIMIFIAINHQQEQQEQQNQKQQQEQNNVVAQKQDNHHQTDGGVDETDNAMAHNSNNTPQSSSTANTIAPKNILSTKPKTNNDPLEVVIVSTAKVQDLIGLICWQYTNEGREPKLHPDISRYCLRIAEDNGEVDPDFGSLNTKEPLSKFNFPSLALTEKSEEKERFRNYGNQYANGNHIYSNCQPAIEHNVMISNTRLSNASSKFAALTRIIFKDAKLDTSQ